MLERSNWILNVVLELGKAARLPVCKLAASHGAIWIRRLGSRQVRTITTIQCCFLILLQTTFAPYQCLAAKDNAGTIASIANGGQSSMLNIPLTKLEPKLAVPDNTAASPSDNQTSPDASHNQTNNNSSSNQASSIPLPPAAPDRRATAGNGTDNYPIVAKMETATFGSARSQWAVNQRLDALEQAVFKKTFNNLSLFDRTQRLQAAILGATPEPVAESGAADDLVNTSELPYQGSNPHDQQSAEANYFDQIAANPENQIETDPAELQTFALQLVNYARSQIGLCSLSQDEAALRMASEQAEDLARRNLISHSNESGKNPDLRYTACGGNDAVLESLAALKREQLKTHNLSKSMVTQVFKTLMSRQDDREALLSPDATGFGFSIKWTADKQRVIACSEISTTHGIIQPLVPPAIVGDKVEVAGSIYQPYKFSRITLAWEGARESMPEAADEAEEALPYFPPLDYIAFSSKSEHDYEKALATLRLAGIMAAMAGGLFIPPVALAAPLIAASGTFAEPPKPLSDIPVHGGIKVDGQGFSGRVPFANGGKEGIYYLTVWASNGRNDKLVPVSRRAYLVKTGLEVPAASGVEDVEGTVISKTKHKKQKSDSKSGANAGSSQ